MAYQVRSKIHKIIPRERPPAALTPEVLADVNADHFDRVASTLFNTECKMSMGLKRLIKYSDGQMYGDVGMIWLYETRKDDFSFYMDEVAQLSGKSIDWLKAADVLARYCGFKQGRKAMEVFLANETVWERPNGFWAFTSDLAYVKEGHATCRDVVIQFKRVANKIRQLQKEQA